MHNFTATPPNKIGFFSPSTSAVNFCELDYAVTPYIAEFVNSFTNFAYIYLSVSSLTPGSWRLNILSWPAANLALMFVGITSFAYHSTLRHGAQMADELSMYAIITALNYRVYTYKLFASPVAKKFVASFLILSTTAVGYYNATSSTGASTTAHLVLFTFLIHTFWLRTLYLIRKDSQSHHPNQPASLTASTHSESQAYEDAARQHNLFRLRIASVLFVLGFIVWVIDGLCCYQLRGIRAKVGLPFAWIFELHGLWHVLTAMGAAKFMRLAVDLTQNS